MKKRIAVFPGSFDPFTVGHQDIVLRALPMFDEIIIAVGENSQKKYMKSLEDRLNYIRAVFKNEPKVSADSFNGLTVTYCKTVNAGFLLRGIRNTADFEYERNIANMNREIEPEIETVFLMCSPQHIAVSSTIVREIIKHGGDASKFLPLNDL